MASTEVADPELVAPPNQTSRTASIDAEAERYSHDIDNKPAPLSDRVDRELGQYTGTGISITPERSNQLRKMIDKRVLTIMIATYFLQAIDKGTLSFASIMGLLEDTGLSVEGDPLVPKPEV